MSAAEGVRRRFEPGTTADDLKAYMGPFVARLGYKFNTETDFVDEVLASELEILERDGDVYCPCRVRSGDPREDAPRASAGGRSARGPFSSERLVPGLHQVKREMLAYEIKDTRPQYGGVVIPQVQVVHNGQVIREQVGAVPEPYLRALVDEVLEIASATLAQ